MALEKSQAIRRYLAPQLFGGIKQHLPCVADDAI